MVDIEHLRREVIRLATIDPAAARLLNSAGDDIQQLLAQRDALLLASTAACKTLEAPCLT